MVDRLVQSPERRNPLTDEVVADLQRICDALQDDRSVRGLTLRGRGGFFCAGGDLKGFKRWRPRRKTKWSL